MKITSSMPGYTLLPEHIKISEMLIREIQTNVLTDGEKLPPEKELASSLGVSLNTLRKALQDLEDKGMLKRVQGSGNYITKQLDDDHVYTFFRLELLTGGGMPTADLLSVKHLAKPDDLLSFGQANKAFRFRRLRKLNRTLVAAEEIWLDGSYATKIDRASVPESLYLYYKQILGFWITEIQDNVSIGTLPDWALPYWHSSDKDKPGSQKIGKKLTGYVERVSKDQNSEVAEFSRTWFDTDFARFVSR